MSTFDAMVETFRTVHGLSPEAACRAAVGRDRNEAEARANWDRYDRLQEAESAATAAILASAGHASDLAPETVAVMEAARRSLGMNITEARTYAANLRDRETRRAGSEHAKRFQQEFAGALTPKVAA
ncbi:hypothetical protein AB0K00_20695 [Dactylosporangium sp. NPDC049525]|uniref:hypothetical protein n=1 Tax=Dactylosporangium sp. NPDC049525 TaxID=3154730 RepID=UPI00343424AB